MNIIIRREVQDFVSGHGNFDYIDTIIGPMIVSLAEASP